MKILVSFENRVRPDSTGMYLLSAFKQLGHEVGHVLPEKIMDVKGGYDLYVKCDDGLQRTQWNPDLHPSHYYAIDTHIETDWRIELSKMFDTVSVVHSQGLKLNWGKEVSWIPVGCDPDVHYVGKRTKKYDGCFIGNFHNNLAGNRVEMLDAFFKKCQSLFFGPRMFREMAEKYAESKIVFNCSINGDVNMRCFEALCSGSCLLTDRVQDLDALGFVDKKHYFGYSSKEELNSLTEMLLNEEETRETVAFSGHNFVVKDHTYAKRMDKLLELTKGGQLCLQH